MLHFEGERDFPLSPVDLWAKLRDARFLVTCIPEATVQGVVQRLPAGQKWSLSYQSKVGPVKWLEPATLDHLPALAREGVKEVLVIPVAFVSDHIETLHEQRILLRGVALEAGIERYEVANALNDCRLFARALARLVRRAEPRVS